jgi:hypothetical protein
MGPQYVLNKELGIYWWDAQMEDDPENQTFVFNYYLRAMVTSYNKQHGTCDRE